MAHPAQQHRLTREEFIAWESTQNEKHDFWRGEVFSMVGARRIHVVIALNIAARLKDHLRGSGCQAFISDMQLEVEAADAVFYPDVFVSCDPADLKAERVLHHPKVIIEVLSETTAAYDRGDRFAAYRPLPSLQEFVLIDPDTRRIDLFRRTPENDWLLATRDAERGLILPSLDFEMPHAAVFEDV